MNRMVFNKWNFPLWCRRAFISNRLSIQFVNHRLNGRRNASFRWFENGELNRQIVIIESIGGWPLAGESCRCNCIVKGVIIHPHHECVWSSRVVFYLSSNIMPTLFAFIATPTLTLAWTVSERNWWTIDFSWEYFSADDGAGHEHITVMGELIGHR